MKEKLAELLMNQGDLSWESIVMNSAMALLLGLLIYVSYMISHRGTIYSKKFNVSLVVLTVLTSTVMTVISNNIALSLGMVGALSIVRFRTSVKDSRDTIYIFWTIIVGICCGVQSFYVAAIGSATVFLILLIFGAIKSDTRVLLIIRGGRSIESKVEAFVYQNFFRKAILRTKNTTKTTIEYIYEISDVILEKSQKQSPNLVNDFYDLGDVDSINFVRQNDDISN